jgi:hypothetical protein
MLEDLSAHVLDISENSVDAGATSVFIEIVEDVEKDLLSMTIEDDGRGMRQDFLAKVTDPFTTTRTTRRVGMGIPFLKQSAELCGGKFEIASEPGVGTVTKASFRLDSIDLPPMGDMPATIMALFMGHPEIDWSYKHVRGERSYIITTAELIEILEDRELLRTAEVGLWIRDNVREALSELRK